MKLKFETNINLSVEVIRDQFGQELFEVLAPGIIPFRLLRFDGCKKGDEIRIKLGFPGLEAEWMSLITFEETNALGWSFIDEGKILPWPLKFWKHHHRVDRISATESKIVDDISFDCHPHFLTPFIKPILWAVFAIRPRRYKNFFKD